MNLAPDLMSSKQTCNHSVKIPPVFLCAAAASAGTVMVLSLYSSKSLEDVAASVPEDTLLFMQLNILRSRVKTEEIIKRVDASGRYKALVVTIDQPVYGRKRAQPLNALLYAKHTQ